MQKLHNPILLSSLLLVFVCSLSAGRLAAQTLPYDTLVKQANVLYELKQYRASLDKYQRAFTARQDRYIDLYNGACAAALAGDSSTATRWLKKSMQRGYSNAAHLQSDPDLGVLHASGEWRAIVGLAEENAEKYSLGAVFGRITRAIESNKPGDLAPLVIADRKAGTSSKRLAHTVEEIYRLLKANELTFDALTPTVSTSYAVVNGVSTSKRGWEYSVAPIYFDRNTNELLRRPLAYVLSMEMIEDAPGWKLNDLSLSSGPEDKNFDIKKMVRDFLSDDAECQLLAIEVMEQKSQAGGIKVKPSTLKIGLDELKLQYDAILPGVGQQHAGHLYVLGLFREVPIAPDKKKEIPFGSSAIFNQGKTTEWQSLEFIFYGDDINVLLISNGKDYGLYKVQDASGIKALVKNNLSKPTD